MSSSKIISLDRFREEEYGRILCYPKFNPTELEERLNELKELSVSAIKFTGPKLAYDLKILGKGHVSLVVVAKIAEKQAALKIRRVDADRPDMSHEVEMLKIANSAGVGPKVFDSTKNFLLMEYIKGTWLPEWIQSLDRKGKKGRIQRVLRILLEKCQKLDSVGIDHGELSRAARHILVNARDKPRIVDFESASVTRRVSNVTSICQYLFIGSHVANLIKQIPFKIDVEKLIEALREYKRRLNHEGFENILRLCGLENVKTIV